MGLVHGHAVFIWMQLINYMTTIVISLVHLSPASKTCGGEYVNKMKTKFYPNVYKSQNINFKLMPIKYIMGLGPCLICPVDFN